MRSWGSWTEVKLDALENYLHAFTVAAKRAPLTLYLDLFAGEAENVSRDTGEVIAGSCERALRVEPGFSRLVACEMNRAKVASLRSALVTRHPGRDIQILEGDTNVEFPRYLADLARRESDWRFAPTFAFIDQLSAEIRWQTLEAVARFKSPQARTKAEMWLYFGESFIPRGLMLRSMVNEAYAVRVDRMFGDAGWRSMLDARRAGELTGKAFKDEMVNLMRWKLERDLGYQRTIPLNLIRGDGHGLYTMIFATDHAVGEKVMTQVLGVSERRLQELRASRRATQIQERNDARSGHRGSSLFDVDATMLGDSGAGRELLLLGPPQPPWTPDRA